MADQTLNFLATRRSGTTGNYNLTAIPNCWVQVDASNPDTRIALYALPEINDAKQVSYSDQPIQGRAAPVKTYANSSNRTIGFIIHLYVTTNTDIKRNLNIIRGIASLAHPQYAGTYLPPNIARLKCGKLLSSDTLATGELYEGIPVVLMSYSVNYDVNVQWFYDDTLETYMPLHVSIDTQWNEVYSWNSLPGADSVLLGRY